MNLSEAHTEDAAFVLSREQIDPPVIARFIIDGEPMSKARPRVVNGHAYTPEQTRIAEERIGWLFRQVTPSHRPSTIESGGRYGVMALFFHATRQRRDIDNMLKLILDGLNGIAWQDDTQVTEISGRKTLVPKGQARTAVLIYELGPNQGLTATCDRCSKQFRTYPSLEGAIRYCSPACRNATVAERALRTCETCSQQFVSKVKRKFCSLECRRLGGRIIQPCAECGKDVERFKSWERNGRPFCDTDCRATYWRKHRAVTAQGVCATCGGHTSKKSYTRCRSCIIGVRT